MAKIAILCDSFPGYIAKCIESLATFSNGINVFALCRSTGTSQNMTNKLKNYNNIEVLNLSLNKISKFDNNKIIKYVISFSPDAAVITLTRTGLFAKIARTLHRKGTIIIGAFDHYWRGTWRDYANMLVSKLGIFSQYEAIFIPGALGRRYAKRLGFRNKVIFEGLYSCDTDIFLPVGIKRHLTDSKQKWPLVFLYVGQYICRKGMDILLEAYSKYRKSVPKPWELWLVGEGELEPLIKKYSDIKNLGFKNPKEIAEIMAQAGCFVLPSRWDHWPLVIHEAACAGLPILATNTCGSSVELIQNGYNGYTFPPNDPLILSNLMVYLSESGMAREMGRNSLQISYRYSPKLWARRILVDISIALRGKSLI